VIQRESANLDLPLIIYKGGDKWQSTQ